MSTVSKKLSSAASGLVHTTRRMELWSNDELEWQHIWLDSSLLLQWAPLLSELFLDTPALGINGLPTFAKMAGSKLVQLSLDCDDALAAAQAGHLFSICTGLEKLVLDGAHISLTGFPPGLRSLQVIFSEIIDRPSLKSSWDPLQASALLHSIARQEHLEDLSLTFRVDEIQLSCPSLNLPRMRVTLEFYLAERMDLDLSWLHSQPCSMLSVIVRADTDKPHLHQLVTDQLQQVQRLHSLTLKMSAAFPKALQLMWKRLSMSTSFDLDLDYGSSRGGGLQALPSSPKITILAMHHGLVLDWAAVTSQAAEFSLQVAPGRGLTILGDPVTPDYLGRAWQLKISADGWQDGWWRAEDLMDAGS